MPKRTGFQEQQPPYEGAPPGLGSVGHARLKIDSAGRIVIPAEMRAAMLVKPGDTLTAEVVDGELVLLSREAAIRKAQQMVRRHVPEGASLSDELIAERRVEARRESGQ